ncbi:GNAT family N-acetyltransferase [Aliidiomarina celeris]|uniref:GNAT family N-acetyltransferase n=1 Tax=Aliidiomarina celeris TaxID=2249428 RepID=UPI000DE8E804|nr:N-acetyltransferase [Aliidiomarina celeris]
MMIRSAAPADMPALFDLEAQTYGSEAYPSLFLHQALLQWPDLLYVACNEQNEILGYALFAPAAPKVNTPNSAWLMSLLVSPQARGQGVGKALTTFGLQHLVEQGIVQCMLTVAPDNASAIQLYQKLGFNTEVTIAHALGHNEHRLLLKWQHA